jgi:hypothetical protein
VDLGMILLLYIVTNVIIRGYYTGAEGRRAILARDRDIGPRALARGPISRSRANIALRPSAPVL